MSHSAICLAVRNTLQAEFDLDSNACEVGFDGTPGPTGAQFYIAVHPLGLSGISGDFDEGEEYTVAVTLSIKLGTTPKDRRGIAVWLDQDDNTGLHQRVRRTITAIHHSYDVMNLANTFITGGGGNIVTPLYLMPGGVQPPKVQNHSWFYSVPPAKGGSMTDDAGVSQTITFGKCQRVQNLQDMD